MIEPRVAHAKIADSLPQGAGGNSGGGGVLNAIPETVKPEKSGPLNMGGQTPTWSFSQKSLMSPAERQMRTAHPVSPAAANANGPIQQSALAMRSNLWAGAGGGAPLASPTIKQSNGFRIPGTNVHPVDMIPQDLQTGAKNVGNTILQGAKTTPGPWNGPKQSIWPSMATGAGLGLGALGAYGLFNHLRGAGDDEEDPAEVGRTDAPINLNSPLINAGLLAGGGALGLYGLGGGNLGKGFNTAHGYLSNMFGKTSADLNLGELWHGGVGLGRGLLNSGISQISGKGPYRPNEPGIGDTFKGMFNSAVNNTSLGAGIQHLRNTHAGYTGEQMGAQAGNNIGNAVGGAYTGLRDRLGLSNAGMAGVGALAAGLPMAAYALGGNSEPQMSEDEIDSKAAEMFGVHAMSIPPDQRRRMVMHLMKQSNADCYPAGNGVPGGPQAFTPSVGNSVPVKTPISASIPLVNGVMPKIAAVQEVSPFCAGFLQGCLKHFGTDPNRGNMLKLAIIKCASINVEFEQEWEKVFEKSAAPIMGGSLTPPPPSPPGPVQPAAPAPAPAPAAPPATPGQSPTGGPTVTTSGAPITPPGAPAPASAPAPGAARGSGGPAAPVATVVPPGSAAPAPSATPPAAAKGAPTMPDVTGRGQAAPDQGGFNLGKMLGLGNMSTQDQMMLGLGLASLLYGGMGGGGMLPSVLGLGMMGSGLTGKMPWQGDYWSGLMNPSSWARGGQSPIAPGAAKGIPGVPSPTTDNPVLAAIRNKVPDWRAALQGENQRKGLLDMGSHANTLMDIKNTLGPELEKNPGIGKDLSSLMTPQDWQLLHQRAGGFGQGSTIADYYKKMHGKDFVPLQ